MNLEMPSPEQTESLRTLLLIVLGVMIVTIPVVCLLVIAKVKAQQRQRPVPGKEGRPAPHDTGGVDPILFAGSSLTAGSAVTSQEGGAAEYRGESAPSGTDGECGAPAPACESSWMDSGSSSFSDGGSSCGGDSGGGGGAGGGGGGSE
ncbi:MAG: hypothetical protein V4675_22950 [Verrucomicrobiota bacterium]